MQYRFHWSLVLVPRFPPCWIMNHQFVIDMNYHITSFLISVSFEITLALTIFPHMSAG